MIIGRWEAHTYIWLISMLVNDCSTGNGFTCPCVDSPRAGAVVVKWGEVAVISEKHLSGFLLGILATCVWLFCIPWRPETMALIRTCCLD